MGKRWREEKNPQIKKSQAMSLEQKKKSDFVVQVFVSSTTPICLHLGTAQSRVDSWETNGPSQVSITSTQQLFYMGKYNLDSRSCFLTSYISSLCAYAIQHSNSHACLQQSFPASCRQLHTGNTFFRTFRLSVSHTSFKLHNLLKSVFKQKAHLTRFSATAPFQAKLKLYNILLNVVQSNHRSK